MAAPSRPVHIYPANNQQFVRADTLIFKWSSVATASGYECQISPSRTFSSLVVSQNTTTDTTFCVTSLQNLTTHYWRVRAYNIGGSSQFTAIDSFTTIIAVPAAPILVSPRSTNNVGRLTLFDGALLQMQ